MGLLDDAIREHLDLKRRRGADPGEIERAEREALGPVRRGPEPAEHIEPGLEEQLAYDHEAQQEWEQPLEDDGDEPAFPTAADSERFDAEEDLFGADEPPLTDEHPRPRGAAREDEYDDFDEPLSAEEPFAEPPGRVAPTPHGAPPEHPGDETAEHDVEAELEEEERDQDADDMLEETPDFLQDTPDHDRLWFEQRPPRDFDIDG